MEKKLINKSLFDETYYEVIDDAIALMSKVFATALDMSEKEKYFLGVEMTQYRHFLEEKLASKQKL